MQPGSRPNRIPSIDSDPKSISGKGPEASAAGGESAPPAQPPAAPDYARHYSEEGFWKKLTANAGALGREFLEKLLVLYHVAADPDTPRKEKLLVFGALGYFILPTDLIPDFLTGVGFSDDIGAITLALATVAMAIKDAHYRKARDKVQRWFPSRASDEEEDSEKAGGTTKETEQ